MANLLTQYLLFPYNAYVGAGGWNVCFHSRIEIIIIFPVDLVMWKEHHLGNPVAVHSQIRFAMSVLNANSEKPPEFYVLF